MCGQPAFVFLGCMQPRNRGLGKPSPSYVCMKEYQGLPRPWYAVRIGFAWPPTKATSCLCSWASCSLGQSSAALLPPPAIASLPSFPVPGKEDVGGLLEPSSSASRGRLCLPRTPTQSSRRLKPSLLHWWFSRA